MIAFMFDKGLEGDEMTPRDGIQRVSSLDSFNSSSDSILPFDYEADFGNLDDNSLIDGADGRVISFAEHLERASSPQNVIAFPRDRRSVAIGRGRSVRFGASIASSRDIRRTERKVNFAFEAAYNHIVVVISVALLAIALLVVVANSLSGSKVSKTVYVVQPGDTIYSIASRFADGGSVSQLEFQLMQEAHGAVIVPGQTLTVG